MRTSRAKSSFAAYATSQGRALGLKQVLVLATGTMVGPRPRLPATWPDPDLLARVAIAGRLVVAAVNCGYLDFVDNWLSSLKALKITNYVLIALDLHAYKTLMEAYPDHTVLSLTVPEDGEHPDQSKIDPNAREYGSAEFGNVVRSRPQFLLPFLRQGYTVFYSDIDTYWLANPFDELRQGEFDFQGPTDSHPLKPDDLQDASNFCTGMLYLEATYPAIRLLETWDALLIAHNADVNQGDFADALAQVNEEAKTTHWQKIKFNILERDAYPPGYMYFKVDDRWKNKDTYVPKRDPAIVHANWVTGKETKRNILKKANLLIRRFDMATTATSESQPFFSAYMGQSSQAARMRKRAGIAVVALIGVLSLVLLVRASQTTVPTNALLPRVSIDDIVPKVNLRINRPLASIVPDRMARMPDPMQKASLPSSVWPDPDLLSRVAIAKRLVVAAVNCGYLDFVDNWLASIQALGITNYILIALDMHAYKTLMGAYPDHTILSVTVSESTQNQAQPDPNAREYGSAGFGNVVRSRPEFLLPFLRQGYTVFYSDIDTFWLGNPFDEIRQGEYDAQGPTDGHPSAPDDRQDASNICTGMLYLEATYPTIRLLEKWSSLLIQTNAEVNQAPFADALATLVRGDESGHTQKIRFNVLERDAYPPGYMYFKKDARWTSMHTYKPKRSPVIVHANWVVGKNKKRQILQEKGLWKPTGKLLPCRVDQ
ncbi:unnamed protein product (mitochondrion) [Plasmodiophora brassicae]|uniref:Nucleotide-diphospho-sugar transferase domain-containing protein n=1 Tax=Plasmodiophora brassicae TaxID=37360 RepID=A0A3P3YFC4_PLABS|nr:unnamed protein product [Plasmodiophora brassicae]